MNDYYIYPSNNSHFYTHFVLQNACNTFALDGGEQQKSRKNTYMIFGFSFLLCSFLDIITSYTTTTNLYLCNVIVIIISMWCEWWWYVSVMYFVIFSCKHNGCSQHTEKWTEAFVCVWVQTEQTKNLHYNGKFCLLTKL